MAGSNLLILEENLNKCRDVSEIASVWKILKCSCKGWNVVDDVREVMWHILVGSILCCWDGEKMNEMQCLYGIENGQGTFMA